MFVERNTEKMNIHSNMLITRLLKLFQKYLPIKIIENWEPPQ